MVAEKARTVIEAYSRAKLMIATAESCTGGMVSAVLTEIPGSSVVLDRGFVTYSYASKTDLLGVPSDMLARFGAVSLEVAQSMARGALNASKADVAVAVTGVAGPGASEAKPEGMVCFACARTGRDMVFLEQQFGALGRAQVRQASVNQALDLLLDVL